MPNGTELTNGRIFRLWLPLLATWVMMSVSVLPAFRTKPDPSSTLLTLSVMSPLISLLAVELSPALRR